MKELVTSFQETVLFRSCQTILKNLISSYQRRQKSVQVYFHLQDALEYCYTETVTKFDVVECSFLADSIGLCNLIPACSGVLADHAEAILCTETQHWIDYDFSLQNYVEESLCCPLSIIPTMYGLRLADHITLGPSSLNFDRKSCQFFWEKVPPFENVALSPSPVLSRSLNQLAKKCFALQQPLEIRNSIKNCLPAPWYSPLTFSYIFGSMKLRLGGENWFQDIPHLSNLPPAFQVAKRTLDAWRNDQRLLKLSVQCTLDQKMEVVHNNYSKSGTRLLRLILVPEVIFENRFARLVPKLKPKKKEKLGLGDIQLLPHVHVIDNFFLEVKKTAEENCATVSFLLLPDHGIGKTHQAILADVVNDAPISFLGSLKSMQVDDHFPYPFDLEEQEPKPLLADFGKTLMTVDSCIEYKDEYHLKIRVESDDTSGKYFLLTIFAANTF